MKNLYILFLFIPLLSVAQQKPELAFTIREKDFIPEGIAYNSIDKSFFVGSIHKHKIVKISSAGKISDFVSTDQDSIGQVVGLRVDETNQHLWACSNEKEGLKGGKSFMHQYDMKTGKLIRKYTYSKAGESHLFNDAILLNGKLYITDSNFGAVFRIDPSTHQLELFLQSDQLRYANGITLLPNSSALVISTANGLATVDTETKSISFLPYSIYYIMGIDGLYFYQNSLVAIQNVTFPVSINRYFLSASNDSISKASVLLVDDANFDLPTTGAIVDDWFYYIANSQLGNYSKGEVTHPEKLVDTKIMRIKIK